MVETESIEMLKAYVPLGNIYQDGNAYTQESLKKDVRRKEKQKSRAAAQAAMASLPVRDDDYGRRIFTSAEKAAALRRTGGICACCGKKLSVSRMTAEHVIPVCWGGPNTPDNIIALCESCNKKKGGLLYLPEGFYTAIIGTPAAKRLETMFAKWFKESCEGFDLESFPLIAPETDCLLVPPQAPHRKKKPVYSPQFVLKWKIAGKEREEEIEELTGMSIQGIRKRMCDLEGVEDSCRVALYTLEKPSTEHIMMLAAVMYREQDDAGAVWTVWADTSSSAIRMGTENLCTSFLYALTKIAGRDLLYYNVYSTVPGALDGIRAGSSHFIGLAWAETYRSGVADSLIVSVINPDTLDRIFAECEQEKDEPGSTE